MALHHSDLNCMHGSKLGHRKPCEHHVMLGLSPVRTAESGAGAPAVPDGAGASAGAGAAAGGGGGGSGAHSGQCRMAANWPLAATRRSCEGEASKSASHSCQGAPKMLSCARARPQALVRAGRQQEQQSQHAAVSAGCLGHPRMQHSRGPERAQSRAARPQRGCAGPQTARRSCSRPASAWSAACPRLPTRSAGPADTTRLVILLLQRTGESMQASKSAVDKELVTSSSICGEPGAAHRLLHLWQVDVHVCEPTLR